MYSFKQISSIAMIAAAVSMPKAGSPQTHPDGVKNIVLVHGAFADGSSWAKVIPILQKKGYHVIAVQNPLTSFEADVAATKSAIEQAGGPVLLVGHSYGGMVISEAGKATGVAGLVYVAALVPEDGQNVNDVNAAMPPTAVGPEFKVSSDGYLSLTEKGIDQFFAQDLPLAERKVIFATQVPWAASALQVKVNEPAWESRPSWYIVAAKDGMINPDLERFKAKLIKAKTLELESSHIPMVSQPEKVASFIVQAAESL